MEHIKQVFWSVAALLVAAGLLAGMVVYTVAAMRTAELQILTGETPSLYRESITN